jgi:hypothetical protein
MLYMLLMTYDPTAERDTANGGSAQAAHGKLEQELRAEGSFVSFAGLMPMEYAAMTRVRRGATTTHDGPFAETKELIAGFYLVEAKDAGEAAEIAARVPVESRAWIDVRQVGFFRADADHVAKLPER